MANSDHGGFNFDGNEEPLFADDLDDYDDDDRNLGTLPPPMTSLSELREAQERVSLFLELRGRTLSLHV